MKKRSTEAPIIGLSGPSAIGKGAYKARVLELMQKHAVSYCEPVVATTRPVRPTDGNDRMAGLSQTQFHRMAQNRELIFTHQPFGPNGHWYGFLAQSFVSDLPLVTEVHVDNLAPFKNRFADRVLLIGFVAQLDCLEANIRDRGTESEPDIQLRLEHAVQELAYIFQGLKSGTIDHVFTVTRKNRAKVEKRVKKIVAPILGCKSK